MRLVLITRKEPPVTTGISLAWLQGIFPELRAATDRNEQERPLTEKQALTLQRIGIEVEGLKRENASKIIELVHKRQECGLAALKQLHVLVSIKQRGADRVSFEDASRILDEATWRHYFDSLRCGPGHLNDLEFAAFTSAKEHGIPIDVALEVVLSRMRSCGAKGIREFKVRQSAERIYAAHLPSGAVHHERAPKAEHDPAYAECLANKLPEAQNAEFVAIRSSLICWHRSPASLLHYVFGVGQIAFVTRDYFATALSEDAWLWTNMTEPDFSSLDFLRTGQRDVWFLSNAVTGTSCRDDRLRGGRSFRCLETLAAWNHLVIETDIVSEGQWLAILAQLELRIKAIYHSGKRGYHALVDTGAQSREQAEEIIVKLEPELIRLGACPGSLTVHRLTRLPNCERQLFGDDGKALLDATGNPVRRLQALIYLNPNPSGQPICTLPPREPPEAVWLRWASTISKPQFKAAASCLEKQQTSPLTPSVATAIRRLENL
jgi:hypothetical protein